MPSISVVIPTCDRPELLALALSDVRAQTLAAHEVIVVDDGARFPPLELPAVVRLLRESGGSGPSASRNLGARHASGEYLAFLDDDDRWTEDYLSEIQATILRAQSQPDVVIARLDLKRGGRAPREGAMPDLNHFEALLLSANPGITGSNIVVRRRFFEEIGGFNEHFRNSNDRDFGLRIVDAGGVTVLCPRAVAVQTLHDGERISTGLASVWRKLPFLVHYWSRMTVQQRMDNVRRLYRIALKGLRAQRGRVFASLRRPLGRVRRWLRPRLAGRA